MIGPDTATTPRAARRARAKAVLLALAAFSLLAGNAQKSAAEEYLLAPEDQIRLKVYEWRASRDQIFEWTALNDRFTVGPDGTLSLPLAGTVKAEGRTVEQLEEEISGKLMRRMGLGIRPDTAVEIVRFRPFYISGQVTAPGEYPYRPGLTVLQAVSIAGGLRTKENDLSRIEREIISGQGDVSVLSLSELTLLARKARLESELANLDQVEFPNQLTDRSGDPMTATVLEQERAIFRTRREGLKTQVRALESLRTTLEQEVASLEGQLGFQDKQIALIQKELTSVSTLVEKGLAAAPREMSLQRELAQFQSGRLAAQTSLLRARQEINRTDISIAELHNRYNNEVTVNLRDTQAQLDELARRRQTAVRLLHESEMFAPRLLALRTRAEELEPTYEIVRTTAEGTQELKADEHTLVEPGDTIKVEMPPLFDMDLTGESFLDAPSGVFHGALAGAGTATAAAPTD